MAILAINPPHHFGMRLPLNFPESITLQPSGDGKGQTCRLKSAI
jgi:hypothetical protein